MSLVDRIAALPDRLPSPTDPARLVATVDAVKARYADFGAVKRDALDMLVARAAAAIRTWTWGELTEGDLAIVIRAMAAREVDMPPALEAFLVEELGVSTRRNLLRALCDGFLSGWAPQNERTATFVRIIAARSAWLPRDWQGRFTNLPELLDVVAGAETFGRWLASRADPYRAVIEKGIAAPHGLGFMRHVHDAWLAAQPPANDDPKVRRLLAWILPDGAPVLRGDRAAAVVARLLQPWTRIMPPEALRSLLAKTLVDAYGDPRRENPKFWQEVGPEGRRVMLRWLAGRRMETFLDVVSRAEAKGDHGDQWLPRRRFWMEVYETGRIDEAWVSFGKDAAEIAGRLGRETNDIAYMEFGRTAKSRKDTCLLIMRIGAKVVVEGSHNFRIHVFDAGRPGAPDLYADEYDVDLFILDLGHEDARVHDAAGRWMDWVRRRVL